MRKPRRTKAEILAERRVKASFYRVGDRRPINVLDLNPLFKVGREAVANGADDSALDEAMRAFVESRAQA